MASDPTALPSLSPEDRHSCAVGFERANQAIAAGNLDAGILLLLSCCRLDPANLVYRQTLRRTQKAKYKNNLRGSRLAWLTASPAKARLRSARRARNYLKVLEHGEEVLGKNPWDIPTQMSMADAADALGLRDLAIWVLEQAREKDPNLATLNRSLARLYEKRGNFAESIALWELVRKSDPSDIEASHKAKDLATQATGPTTPSRPHPADLLAQEAEPLLARIEAEPTRPGLYLDLAALYRRHDLLEEARAVLHRGLGPTGHHYELMLELAELEVEPFRHNLQLTEAKLQDAPDDEELEQIRQDLRKEINRREMDIFRMKADRYPNEPSHRVELGIRLVRAGQFDEASAELQQARSDARLGWKALLHLGYCSQARGDWAQGRRHLDEALQVVPADQVQGKKEILFLLAQGCAEAGELAETVELGQELAALDPTYRNIGVLLEQWQARLQKA